MKRVYALLILAVVLVAIGATITVQTITSRPSDVSCSGSTEGAVWFNWAVKKFRMCENGTAADVPNQGGGGGGISSLNAQTGSIQTMVVGTAGNDVGVSSASNVHTINVPDASATARGVVTTGAQTFAGAKTFSSLIGPLTGPASDVTCTACVAIGELTFDPATQAELDAHVTNPAGAHAATAISFAPAGTVTAGNVQAAIEEVAGDAAAGLNTHLTNPTGAHAASAIVFTPAGPISAINTQTAIEEVATDAATALTTHEADTTNVHGIADTAVLQANTPTADQKAALAGSHGTPNDTNRYLTKDAIDHTNGVAGLDDNEELINPEVVTGSFILNGAGPPSAGSCPHGKAMYRDTTALGDLYICFGVGQNWHYVGANDSLQIPDTIATCDVSLQGMPRYKINASGVADQVLFCTKLPDNNYYWVGPPEEIIARTGTSTDACEATPADDFGWAAQNNAVRAVVQTQSRAGYYTRLRSRTQVTIPSGQTLTAMFELNAGNTTLTCTQSNAQTCSSDAVVAVTDGQLVNIRESCTTGGAATSHIVTVVFYPN